MYLHNYTERPLVSAEVIYKCLSRLRRLYIQPTFTATKKKCSQSGAQAKKAINKKIPAFWTKMTRLHVC